MKEIKLIVDGKEVKLTKEQIAALNLDMGCVCDRVTTGNPFYYLDEAAEVAQSYEIGNDYSDDLYNSGNYYRKKKYAEQIALHRKLNNLLRRYNEQHSDINFIKNKNNYTIIFRDMTPCINSQGVYKSIEAVHFSSRENCKKAIEEIVKPFMEENPNFIP